MDQQRPDAGMNVEMKVLCSDALGRRGFIILRRDRHGIVLQVPAGESATVTGPAITHLVRLLSET